ncbi:MAG: hypothetical protein ACE14L_01675 [Terriglobales bacterium]
MITPEVLQHLANAIHNLHNASFSGSARNVVADGYSAIDASFSAVLIDAGYQPPKNHKEKLSQAEKLFPNLLQGYRESTRGGGTIISAAGVAWPRITSFYREWLTARYETFSLTADQARRRCVEAARAVACCMRFIAASNGVGLLDLEDSVKKLAFGYLYSEADQAVGKVHERRFARAEQYGEMHGAKLGTKLAETSNYCTFSIVADDALTRGIIKDDSEIAEECADLYERFLRLVELIEKKRHWRLAPSQTELGRSEPDEVPDFMLALRFRYHGAKVSELGKQWAELIGMYPCDHTV